MDMMLSPQMKPASSCRHPKDAAGLGDPTERGEIYWPQGRIQSKTAQMTAAARAVS
jgi:hypothetical protein